jgi:hypothetical protein
LKILLQYLSYAESLHGVLEIHTEFLESHTCEEELVHLALISSTVKASAADTVANTPATP